MTVVELCFIFVFAVASNVANGSPLIQDESVLIVGGDEVNITEYPYQALVLLANFFQCGGSIISDEYILTAAHCFSGYDMELFTVKVGSSYLTEGGQTYNLSNIYVHPNFNYPTLDYDVAVLKTSKKLTIDNVTTKVVKMADSGSSMTPGDYIVVSGWGRIEEGGPASDVLRAVAVPFVSREYCKGAYEVDNLTVTDRMFCAGFDTGGKDACAGDSGGPAVDEKSRVQYGIVSWGVGCARKEYPGVYTDIPVVRDWITEVTGFKYN